MLPLARSITFKLALNGCYNWNNSNKANAYPRFKTALLYSTKMMRFFVQNKTN